jgi:hypothetical protein
MNHLISALVLLFCLSPIAANAQALNTKTIEALNNVQMEYTTCIVYFTKLLKCSPKEMEAESTRQLTPTIRKFVDMASQIAATIGLTDDAVGSRFKMVADEQNQVTKDSCINFSSLYNRHGQRCKKLGEEGDSIYDEYLNK